MTDTFRALCAELLDALENAIRVIYHEDGTKHISTADAVIAKADAALAQPEPVGPTDEEIDALLPLGMAQHSTICGPREIRAFARAVLQRWGHPTLTPIPVSERLPGAEDCDEEGRCWWSAHAVGGPYWHL